MYLVASRGFDAIGLGYTAPLSHWSRTVRVRAPTGLSLIEGTLRVPGMYARKVQTKRGRLCSPPYLYRVMPMPG
jgi:hypothetical protein